MRTAFKGYCYCSVARDITEGEEKSFSVDFQEFSQSF
jgi:hypothetical protein